MELKCKCSFYYLKHLGHLTHVNPLSHPSSVLPVFTVHRNRPSKATIPNVPRWRFLGSNRTEHNTETNFNRCFDLYSFCQLKCLKYTQISPVDVQRLTSSRVSLSVQHPTENPDHSQRAGQTLRSTNTTNSSLDSLHVYL